MKVANAASLCGDLGVVQRLQVLLVVVVDLELAALDEAKLHARQRGLDRPDVRLVPVLDQELLARRVRDVGLDGGEVGELALGHDRRQPRLRRLPQELGAVGERFADEVAVDVPAAIEAPLRRDVAVRREHPGLEARLLHVLGDEGNVLGQARLVRGRAVHGRVDAGQQRRVRRQRPGAGDLRPREPGRVGGEGVVVGRRDARLRVVGAQLVGAQRVDHPDEDVVELRLRAGRGRRGPVI